jgi:hypothetical protein
MKAGIGKMIPFPSVWGHWAGGTQFDAMPTFLIHDPLISPGPGDSKDDVKWLDDQLSAFLAEN